MTFHIRNALFGLISYLLLYCLIVVISLIGDHLHQLSLPSNRVLRYAIALSDTTIHGAIGSLSWSMFVVLQFATTTLSNSPSDVQYKFKWTLIVRDVFLCGFVAILVDFDHVIAAGSFSIESLTTLKSRPFLHNTTLLMVTCLGLITTGCFISDPTCSHWLLLLGYLLLIGSMSHHIRDALRRGFTLWPLWSVPPVSMQFYFASLFLLPILTIVLCQHHGKPIFVYQTCHELDQCANTLMEM